jgi:hypothetical protein
MFTYLFGFIYNPIIVFNTALDRYYCKNMSWSLILLLLIFKKKSCNDEFVIGVN